jgi:hypothetical protein
MSNEAKTYVDFEGRSPQLNLLERVAREIEAMRQDLEADYGESAQTDHLGSKDAKEAEVCEKEVENDNDILKIQLKVESTQQTR